MIGYLSGTILSVSEKSFLLDVSGVGYEIRANTNCTSKIQVGSACSCFIHTHVREDDISLFGFLTHQEKELFLQLISVSGVGPKTALEILNNPISLLTEAIFNEDKALLSKTPGIGGKTAEKIILELKNKVKPTSIDTYGSQKQNTTSDIYLALEQLGYNRVHINEGLKKMNLEGKKEEEIIKEFLKLSYQS